MAPKAKGQWIGNLRGENGGQYINLASGTKTGQWYAIVCVEDTVIDAITQPDMDNSTIIEGITLAAGTVIYGETTSILLASGLVAAHRF